MCCCASQKKSSRGWKKSHEAAPDKARVDTATLGMWEQGNRYSVTGWKHSHCSSLENEGASTCLAPWELQSCKEQRQNRQLTAFENVHKKRVNSFHCIQKSMHSLLNINRLWQRITWPRSAVSLSAEIIYHGPVYWPKGKDLMTIISTEEDKRAAASVLVWIVQKRAEPEKQISSPVVLLIKKVSTNWVLYKRQYWKPWTIFGGSWR